MEPKETSALDSMNRLAGTTAEPSDYAKELIGRVDSLLSNCRNIIYDRASQGYGDALTPTGGYMNTFALLERKMDRLRNKVWKPGLNGENPNDPFDTIDDLINYALFLRLQLEDYSPSEHTPGE